MKKVIYSMFAAAMIIGAVSCSSDDDGPSTITPADITNTVTSGAWRVTNFVDNDTDETNNFTGYNFTFGSSNVLTATNGTNTYTGVWTVSAEDPDDDNPHLEDLDFDIFFGSPDNFTDLSEDWDIIERTSTKIRFKHVSGGDGSVDYLTFEKNT